jgi:peroxiredoxin
MENNQSEVDRMIAERFSALRPDGDWQPDLERGLALLRQRQAAAKGRTRRWAVITAGAVAACLPIMAFPVTRALAQRCVSACVVETAAVRQFLLGKTASAAPHNTYLKPSDRPMAPDFTLNDASGQPVRLSAYRGKVVLLNFWATWCVPCRQEIPWFAEFQRSNQQRGFAVLGVSMDEDGWRSVKPFLREKHVNYPVMIGNDQISALFGGLQSLPLTLLIDRSGRIATVHAGLCTKQEYERDINAVLNER